MSWNNMIKVRTSRGQTTCNCFCMGGVSRSNDLEGTVLGTFITEAVDPMDGRWYAVTSSNHWECSWNMARWNVKYKRGYHQGMGMLPRAEDKTNIWRESRAAAGCTIRTLWTLSFFMQYYRWSISCLPWWPHFTEKAVFIKGYDFNYTSIIRGPPTFDKAL